MPNSSEFIAYLLEQLAPMGAVSAKRMFGGHGLFFQGLMFALVINDQPYLKADEQLAQKFSVLGLERFSYSKQGKTCYINYYQAPESCLDDPEELLFWSHQAFQVALAAS